VLESAAELGLEDVVFDPVAPPALGDVLPNPVLVELPNPEFVELPNPELEEDGEDPNPLEELLLF